METIEEVGAKEFLQLIKTAGLEKKLMSETLTLFVPDNAALSNAQLGSNQIESVCIRLIL